MPNRPTLIPREDLDEFQKAARDVENRDAFSAVLRDFSKELKATREQSAASTQASVDVKRMLERVVDDRLADRKEIDKISKAVFGTPSHPPPAEHALARVTGTDHEVASLQGQMIAFGSDLAQIKKGIGVAPPGGAEQPKSTVDKLATSDRAAWVPRIAVVLYMLAEAARALHWIP